MEWTIRSSWTYDESGSVDLAFILAKNEKKYGQIKKIRIKRSGWSCGFHRNKTKWLTISMTGTEEQKSACDELLLDLMNGDN